MSALRLFATLAVVYATVVPGLYLAVRLALTLSYYPPLRQKRRNIRTATIAYWQNKYKTLEGVLDNVLVEDLRVIGRHNEVENRRLAHITWIFYLLSAFMLLDAAFVGVMRDDYIATQATLPAVLLAVLGTAQLVTLSMLIFANYYEYQYYKTLERLAEEAGAVSP